MKRGTQFKNIKQGDFFCLHNFNASYEKKSNNSGEEITRLWGECKFTNDQTIMPLDLTYYEKQKLEEGLKIKSREERKYYPKSVYENAK